MKRFLSLLLCLFILTSCFACGGSSEKAESDDKRQEEVVDDVKKPETEVVVGKYFVKDKTSEYKILVQNKEGEDNSIENYASSEFQTFFNEATGVLLPIIKSGANVNANGKYISIGETVASSGISVSNTANSQAFCIKNAGDSIFVVGNSNYGTLWGVYELLSIMFNYEFYAADTYYIDTNVSDLPYFTVDYTDEPAIEYRATGDGQSYTDLSVSRRFRYLKADKEFFLMNGTWSHNSFYYFGAEDFGGNVEKGAAQIRNNYPDYFIDDSKKSDTDAHYFISTHNKQLCYTAHGNPEMLNKMIEIVVDNIVEIANSTVKLDHIIFGMMDSDNQWCACRGCQNAKEEYGSDSGAVVNFCNRVYEGVVQAYKDKKIDRIIGVSFFAYNKLESAPVKNGEATVKCADGVSVLCAPIYADWTVPFNDSKNQTYFSTLKDWGTVCNSIYLWAYHTNYHYFIYPYDCFNSSQINYKLFAEEYNVKFIFNQGKHKLESASGFTTLAEYINSKLSWNYNLNVEKLTEEFFDNYFGPASKTMKQFYTEIRTLLVYNHDVKNMPGGVYGNLSDKKYWPEATVINWLGLIEKAYQDISRLEQKYPELYKKYYSHIKLESLMPRIIYIENIAEDYSAEKMEMISLFKKDCEELRVSYYSEEKTIQEKLA